MLTQELAVGLLIGLAGVYWTWAVLALFLQKLRGRASGCGSGCGKACLSTTGTSSPDAAANSARLNPQDRRRIPLPVRS